MSSGTYRDQMRAAYQPRTRVEIETMRRTGGQAADALKDLLNNVAQTALETAELLVGDMLKLRGKRLLTPLQIAEWSLTATVETAALRIIFTDDNGGVFDFSNQTAEALRVAVNQLIENDNRLTYDEKADALVGFNWAARAALHALVTLEQAEKRARKHAN